MSLGNQHLARNEVSGSSCLCCARQVDWARHGTGHDSRSAIPQPCLRSVVSISELNIAIFLGRPTALDDGRPPGWSYNDDLLAQYENLLVTFCKPLSPAGSLIVKETGFLDKGPLIGVVVWPVFQPGPPVLSPPVDCSRHQWFPPIRRDCPLGLTSIVRLMLYVILYGGLPCQRTE